MTVGPHEINGVEVEPLIGFALTFLTNFSGHPSASILMGFNKENVPMGLHVISGMYEDEKIFSFANYLEKHPQKGDK